MMKIRNGLNSGQLKRLDWENATPLDFRYAQ